VGYEGIQVSVSREEWQAAIMILLDSVAFFLDRPM
jgi:hypothetical protein